MSCLLVANDALGSFVTNYGNHCASNRKRKAVHKCRLCFQLVLLGLIACQPAWGLEKQGYDFDSYLRGEMF